MASACTNRFQDLGSLSVLEYAWTAHTDGSFTDFTPDRAIDGLVHCVETVPDGTTAPTTLYDVTLETADGLDVCGGGLANRSATVAERYYPAYTAPVMGPLTLTISNNSVNAAKGVVRVFYLRFDRY